jgi:hypothetical protein
MQVVIPLYFGMVVRCFNSNGSLTLVKQEQAYKITVCRLVFSSKKSMYMLLELFFADFEVYVHVSQIFKQVRADKAHCATPVLHSPSPSRVDHCFVDISCRSSLFLQSKEHFQRLWQFSLDPLMHQ